MGFYSGKYWATVSGIGVTISPTCNKPNCSPPAEQRNPLRKPIRANLVTAAALQNLNCNRMRKGKCKTKAHWFCDAEIMQGNAAHYSRNTDRVSLVVCRQMTLLNKPTASFLVRELQNQNYVGSRHTEPPQPPKSCRREFQRCSVVLMCRMCLETLPLQQLLPGRTMGLVQAWKLIWIKGECELKAE